MYIWLPITQTLYGNKNYFELTGGLSYQGSNTKMYEGNPGEIDFGLSLIAKVWVIRIQPYPQGFAVQVCKITTRFLFIHLLFNVD